MTTRQIQIQEIVTFIKPTREEAITLAYEIGGGEVHALHLQRGFGLPAEKPVGYLVQPQRSKDSTGKTVSMYEFLCMKQTAESYKELMDATAKDADKAYELLRRAETEMRYAGWTKFESDNPARKDIYDDIKEFLK
jgi:hypothetical protein